MRDFIDAPSCDPKFGRGDTIRPDPTFSLFRSVTLVFGLLILQLLSQTTNATLIVSGNPKIDGAYFAPVLQMPGARQAGRKTRFLSLTDHILYVLSGSPVSFSPVENATIVTTQILPNLSVRKTLLGS